MNLYKNRFLIGLLIFIILSLATYYFFGLSNETFVNGTTGIKTICKEGESKTGCYDISYIDPISGVTKSVSAKIEQGYFIDVSGYLQSVPDGNVVSLDMHSYMPITKIQLDTSMNKTSNKAYNSDNLDIIYHPDPMKENPTSNIGKMWVDISGNLVSVPYSDVRNTTLYYQPGTYKYNSASYVPNYEDSVLLSKYTNQSINQPIDKSQDICAETKGSLIERDAKCNTVDINNCASTSCCILLGGEKCVAGDEFGPSIKSNYSDHTIVNRDYYYYRGQCYGHCV